MQTKLRLERSKNVAVREVAVKGNAGDDKFGFTIVEPADGVLLPEGGKDQAVRRGGRRVVSLQRLRESLYGGSGGGGGLRSNGRLHLHGTVEREMETDSVK